MANSSNAEMDILENRPKPVRLPKWAILFVSEKELGKKPAACSGCTILLKRQKRCSIIGPEIVIEPITKDGQLYTPVCGQHDPGKPIDVPDSAIKYASELQGADKADAIGLEWAKGKGTNCYGEYGGAPCSFYTEITEEDGFCTPLQEEVHGGDCCATHKGPSMSWREAQRLLKK